MQPSRRVDDHRIEPVQLRPPDGRNRQFHGARALPVAVHVYLELISQDPQLLDRCRAVYIRRYEQGPSPVLLHDTGKLPGGGRLPRSLQPHEHDWNRWGSLEIEGGGILPHQGGELIAHDLDEVLLRRKRPEHLFSQALLLHRLDEILDHPVIHVGLEKGELHLTNGLSDVFRRYPSLPFELLYDTAQLIRQRLEHVTILLTYRAADRTFLNQKKQCKLNPSKNQRENSSVSRTELQKDPVHRIPFAHHSGEPAPGSAGARALKLLTLTSKGRSL